MPNNQRKRQTDPTGLLRRAAQAGPGQRGRRLEPGPDERTQLLAELELAGLQAPDYLVHPRPWIDRQAVLFKAGDYPDKGVNVTAAHLGMLAESFDLPVPILIEHSRSPLEIGYLTDVRAEGEELRGTVTLTKEASELIDRSGAHGLSLGLSSDLSEIREVSLVREPRVAGARLFGGGVRFTGSLSAPGLAWLWSRVAELEAEGRLVPAQRPFLAAILESAGHVEFDGASVPVGHLAVRLLEAGPRSLLFAETATVAQTDPSTRLDPDEAEFYSRHFPGLSLEEIARNRRSRP